MTDTASLCSSCGVGARKVVINAYHIWGQDWAVAAYGNQLAAVREESKRCDNGMIIPVNYSGLVSLVENFRRLGPINELEIAAHGTGAVAEGSQPDPANYRLYETPEGQRVIQRPGTIRFATDTGATGIPPTMFPPGAAVLGRTGELVSGMSIETVPIDASLSRRLGACVAPGGIITWQCCNLGIAMEPYRDFLKAFSALAPHLASVTAAMGLTIQGTPGLTGDRSFEGYRAAQNGQDVGTFNESFGGFLPDRAWPATRRVDAIQDSLAGRAPVPPPIVR